MRRLLAGQEPAQYLKTGKSTPYKLVRQGKLPAHTARRK